MKDTDLQILHAFLFALACQEKPLSDDVKYQLHEIAQSFDRRTSDLDALAMATPSLAVPYQEAYDQLHDAANLRSKGVLPAEEDEGENSGEYDGLVMLGDIQRKLLEAQELAYRILNAKDPVQQAKQTFQITTNSCDPTSLSDR
ncbi:MAG: hypothetical protein Kow00121_20650 [Elainellaceae cyanobacterium]